MASSHTPPSHEPQDEIRRITEVAVLHALAHPFRARVLDAL